MTARAWRELWRADMADGTQTASLEVLDVDGRPVPGGVVLTANDGGDTGWITLDYASAVALRNALSRWLDEQLDLPA